jgi:hypothetical protein
VVERVVSRPAGRPRRIDPGHELRRLERWAVEVALALLAAHRHEQPRLLGLFDALRDECQVECLAHGDDRLGDGRVVAVGGDAAAERLVDLELVDRQALEIAQGRLAGAEIIDGELDAHLAELAQDLQRVVGCPHDRLVATQGHHLGFQYGFWHLEASTCRVYQSDMKVRVDRANRFYYPDIMRLTATAW